MSNKRRYGHYDGFDKEPKQPHGPKAGGKQPMVHSHSAMPKRKIGGHKRGHKKAAR